jgi:hypothetical protein
MNIGLLDIDSHNFPNLALMKISAYHKSIGDKIEFADMFSHYDIIYKSKVFTWTPDNDYIYNCDKYIQCGTGYNYSVLDTEIHSMCPDYSLYNCEHAYGFLTRGCVRNCEWCIVPEKEGKIKQENDIEDFIDNKKSAILMDNNVLASEYGIKQLEKIAKLELKIDFNQGLDARLIDDSIAKILSKIKWLHPIRLACDNLESFEYLHRAVEILRWRNCRPGRYFVYCLVKNTEEAMERIKKIKGIYCEPFCQPYIDFRNNIMPKENQKRFSRWVNNTSVFNSVFWEEYKYK